MITLQLSFSELQLLTAAFSNVPVSQPNGHGALLREHVADFIQLFGRPVTNRPRKYRVKLTSTQALAFMQIWGGTPIYDTAQANIILRTIWDIDHASKRPRMLNRKQFVDKALAPFPGNGTNEHGNV